MRPPLQQRIRIISRQLRELSGLYREPLRIREISENEFWIWHSLITLQETVTQQDICSIYALPKQTVNTIVAGMVRDGYAQLETVPGTRNRKSIRLTPAGLSRGQSIVDPVFAAEQRAFARLSDEDQTAFLHFLQNYTALLKEELHEI